MISIRRALLAPLCTLVAASCAAAGAASAAIPTRVSAAGACTPQTIRTALGPTRMRFVLRGHVSCAVAHRVVRNYFARTPGQCQGSGCYIRLPSGWSCLSEPGEVTAKTGHIAVCERGRARINTYEQR